MACRLKLSSFSGLYSLLWCKVMCGNSFEKINCRNRQIRTVHHSYYCFLFSRKLLLSNSEERLKAADIVLVSRSLAIKELHSSLIVLIAGQGHCPGLVRESWEMLYIIVIGVFPEFCWGLASQMFMHSRFNFLESNCSKRKELPIASRIRTWWF